MSFTSLGKFDTICLIKWDKLGTRCSLGLKAGSDHFSIVLFFLEEARKKTVKQSYLPRLETCLGFGKSESPKYRVGILPLKLCELVETERGGGSECKQ